MIYLLDEVAARSLADARAHGAPFSADQLQAFESRNVAASGDPKNARRAGSTMEIRVEGILTEKPDLFAAWFGGGNTTYDSIVQSLAIAANDPSIKEVVLSVNSPGGTVDGIFEALDAIESFRTSSGKKIRAVASKAQSAAFAIAAMAGPITAKNAGSVFGSIGTAIDFTVFSSMKTVSITNTDSPAKRPDPTTDEGRAEIVRFLDSINSLFVDAIGRGRGVASAHVTKNYGRGASFTAADAKRRGMIDAIAKPAAQMAGGSRSMAGAAAPGSMTARALELVEHMHGRTPARASAPGRDLGDLVVAQLFGEDHEAHSHHRFAPVFGDIVNADLAGEDDRAPAAFARSGRDLGDLVAEHLFGEDDQASRPGADANDLGDLIGADLMGLE